MESLIFFIAPRISDGKWYEMRVRPDKDVLQSFTQSVYWNTPRQWLCRSVPVRMNGACHMPMASPLALHVLALLVHALLCG